MDYFCSLGRRSIRMWFWISSETSVDWGSSPLSLEKKLIKNQWGVLPINTESSGLRDTRRDCFTLLQVRWITLGYWRCNIIQDKKKSSTWFCMLLLSGVNNAAPTSTLWKEARMHIYCTTLLLPQLSSHQTALLFFSELTCCNISGNEY